MSHKIPKSLSAYKFPISEHGSMFFATKGAKVKKATFEVNGSTLSVIIPVYDSNMKNKEYSEPYDLKFFGDKPFHRSLLKDCEVVITLYTHETIPSIMFGYLPDATTWNDVPGDIYIDEVTVGSNNGPRNLKLAYKVNECGYVG